MAIAGQGWELLVSRLGVQQSGRRKRTYGAYQAFLDGRAIASLAGHMCECVGPGDNLHAENNKRIEQGRYPLSTQFGRYRTSGYSQDLQTPGAPPMPALKLDGTGKRVGILIHPGHPPNLYLSSIGCFNPTGPLTADQTMDFWDSRTRVIALIDSLRGFAPAAFRNEANTPVPDAFVVVEGEPMIALEDSGGAAPAG
jgi:hypothetical protein